MPPRARWPSTATDNDRVGIRQPPPRGGIDGPCKLRGSSSRLGAAAARTARHLVTGAAPPRHNAWSSVDNPRASGLTADSTAKVHPYRASTEARERGGMPGLASGATDSVRGTALSTVAGASAETAPPEATTAAAAVGVHPPVRGRRAATGRMASSPTTLPPSNVGGKWRIVAVADPAGRGAPTGARAQALRAPRRAHHMAEATVVGDLALLAELDHTASAPHRVPDQVRDAAGHLEVREVQAGHTSSQ